MNNFENKKVSIPLAIGIFVIPIIFAWFTLKKGYSNTARLVSFGWLLLAIVVFVTVPQSAMEKSAFEDVNVSH